MMNKQEQGRFENFIYKAVQDEKDKITQKTETWPSEQNVFQCRLLTHDCFLKQLHKLKATTGRAYESNPAEAANNASVKLFQAVSTLVMKNIPDDPTHTKYRQGKKLGKEHTLWRRYIRE